MSIEMVAPLTSPPTQMKHLSSNLEVSYRLQIDVETDYWFDSVSPNSLHYQTHVLGFHSMVLDGGESSRGGNIPSTRGLGRHRLKL